MRLLLGCKNTKPYLFENVKCLKDVGNEYYTYNNNKYLEDKTLNGKIVAECDFGVEKIKTIVLDNYSEDDTYKNISYTTKTLNASQLRQRCCKYYDDMVNCLNDNNGYAIHIKNLHIFDKPIELSKFVYEDNNAQILEAKSALPQFKVIATGCKDVGGIFVCEGIYGRYVSLKSEELCRILNGEQTIIVVKKVLKEMLKCQKD